ncbi:MAG TPA: glycosyltransferase [Stellaceae bacterium]|nr:glycosyltransferase [Stellaceae bacterium]
MRLAYLVHNLADPGVAKRVRMLTACGDALTLFGFRRDDDAADYVEGAAAIDLGRTFDADFRQRIMMVLRRAMDLPAWAPGLAGCDVIIARNLETFFLAVLARRRYAPCASLVYESLDIHRLLLSKGLVGKAMRWLERMLMRRADLLIVSSPGFLREYFVPMQRLDKIETLLVENKLLALSSDDAVSLAIAEPPRPCPPWHIGWFGMIRCRKSLDYLSGLAARRPDLLRVMIKGRPSYTEFADFDGQVAAAPGMSFGGPYRPAELGSLYDSVHFCWAMDFFEEGGNSNWLLPNRVYEGGAYGSVPIAIDGTETARWLQQHGIGVILRSLDDLEEFLTTLDPLQYEALKTASATAPRNAFVASNQDCRRLLDALHGARARHTRAEPPATKTPASGRNADFQRRGRAL